MNSHSDVTDFLDSLVGLADESLAVLPDYTAAKLASIRDYAAFCEGGHVASQPLEIFLEVSNLCDLKCAMCWQFSALNTNRLQQLRNQDRGFLDADSVADNMDGALKGALLVHCFGFGEPTLHPSFRAIVDQITRLGCMADFYTNGMHLDEAMCEFLVERGVCQIIVSFSGVTKEIYENIYIGGNFERVLAGIGRLSAAKKAGGSIYPVIHINSIGFEDHVARFDEFVELVAAYGANVVFLRKLDVHPHMPQLFEHVSIMRPEHEAQIIERARAAGLKLGVRLDVDLYARHAASDTVDYILQEAVLREGAGPALQRQNRAFGKNPLRSFQEIAKAMPSVRPPASERKRSVVLDLAAEPETAREALGIQPAVGEGAVFHCMEPFKTLYVTRNGPAKPCCFANPTVFLGDAKQDDAVAVWQGAGYTAVRTGIARNEYPDFCSGCLKNKSAPGHFAGPLVEMYLAWHEAMFGGGIRAELKREAPGAQQVIARARPAEIMQIGRT